jgi:hypothetical protein
MRSRAHERPPVPRIETEKSRCRLLAPPAIRDFPTAMECEISYAIDTPQEIQQDLLKRAWIIGLSLIQEPNRDATFKVPAATA